MQRQIHQVLDQYSVRNYQMVVAVVAFGQKSCEYDQHRKNNFSLSLRNYKNPPDTFYRIVLGNFSHGEFFNFSKMQKNCFFLCSTGNLQTFSRNSADLGYRTVLVIDNHVQTKNNDPGSCHGTSPVVLEHYMLIIVQQMRVVALSLGPPHARADF